MLPSLEGEPTRTDLGSREGFYFCLSFLSWHNALLFENIAPFVQIFFFFSGHLFGMIGDLLFISE